MMRLKVIAVFLAALMLMAFAGCAPDGGKNENPESENGGEEQAAEPEYPVDAAGASLESRPGIVVSLAPSLTDKLVDMELLEKLEGISDNCAQPHGFDRIRCGDSQAPDVDMILELAPQLVLTDIELPASAASELKGAGIEIAMIPRADNLDGLKQNYLTLARLLEGGRSGVAVGGAFNKRLEQRVSELSQNASGEPKNAVLVKRLDYEVATGDTLESELIELIGLNNIASDQTDWIYPEEIANGDGREAFESIDFIFCDKNSVTIKDMEKSAFFKGLNAVLKDYYLYIDSTAFERQSLKMFAELERMQQYSKGEIPGSKDEGMASEA